MFICVYKLTRNNNMLNITKGVYAAQYTVIKCELSAEELPFMEYNLVKIGLWKILYAGENPKTP